MKKIFYLIIASQFFSSIGDNALLIAAIALLNERSEPEFLVPILKLCFVFFYVVLAAFVGAFADAYPKGKIMLCTNSIKITGCILMLYGIHPLIAYAIVGAAAAAYSPAKYGILTELLPSEKLIAANGWIEGTTVASIVLGTILGGTLVTPSIAGKIIALEIPHIHQPAVAAIACIGINYIIAALFNLGIPNTGATYDKQSTNFYKLIKQFSKANQALWHDPIGQISLAATSLLWGAGAALQLIILKWAEISLNLPLPKATFLQAIFAIGLAVGAILASNCVTLNKAIDVLPIGLIIPILVACIGLITDKSLSTYQVPATLNITIPIYLLITIIILISVGLVSGFFIVPMNALLQHRGSMLLSAGHSIAVQNFNENLSILGMLSLYAILIQSQIQITHIIFLLSIFIFTSILLILIKKKSLINVQFHKI